MNKILFAVGHKTLEDYIQKRLKREFNFVGATVYREGVIRNIGQSNPDIVVIRETLVGKENILSIVYEIRNKFPGIRIVFIAGKRNPGDELLATLVGYGVYDILHGEKIQAQDVIALIRKPNLYKDVQHLQPKPVLDEKKNRILFETPEVLTIEKEIIKEVVKEVFIDNGKEEEQKSVKEPTSPRMQDSQDKEAPTSSSPNKEEKENAPADELIHGTQKVIPKAPTKAPKNASKPMSEETKEKKGLLERFFGKEETLVAEEKLSVDGTSGKQKILTFIGSKSGVGNTSIALNTAVSLAQRKHRVIYIEMNSRTPAVSYWFELGHIDQGIDTALRALADNEFDKIKDAIVRTSGLREKESDLQKNYRKFPEQLDFMFFSQRYLTRKSEDEMEINLSLTKELYLFLLFQLEYDYIVLDVTADIESESTVNALLYSNKAFVTVTQDVSSIGNAVYVMNELNKRGIQIAKKTNYIVNRFEKAELGMKEIADWIQVDDLLTVPCFNKEFINANFIGLPVTIHSKNPQIKSAFQRIEKIIL